MPEERDARDEPPRVGLSYEDPFATPPADYRDDRRLRGRLPSPVTLWTAGRGFDRAGLTVSSVLLAEGDPPYLLGLVDPLSDLHEAMRESGLAVVHLLGAGDGALGRLFSGTVPGDPFAEVSFEEASHGPVLEGRRSRVHCRLGSSEEIGFRALVCLSVEEIVLDGEETDPLVWYRAAYRSLSPPRG